VQTNACGTCRILLLDTKRSNPNHYLCIALRDALSEHPDVEMVFLEGYLEAIRRALQSRCNLFIAFDGEQLHRETCARLAAICGRSILWVTEDPYEIGVNLANSEIFDLVMTNDSASVGRYGQKGRHLPLAASPSLHFLEVLDDESCRYDLFFAGTAWPNRVELLKKIMRELEGLKVKLILPHNENIPQPRLPMALSAYSWRTPNNQFVRFANTSRVVLSLHRCYTNAPDGYAMAATPGPRLFEVALAGGFQLVDLSLHETTRYFAEGREVAGFRTVSEAMDKLRYFLGHPQERQAIARRAQEKAFALHTYKNRADVLLAEAAALADGALGSSSTSPRAPRLLFVTHNRVGVSRYGGIEFYQDGIARGLRNEFGWDVFFYVPDNTAESKACRLLDASYRVLSRVSFATVATQDVLTCPERERAFSRLLTEQGIDAVHFQHLTGHVPSLPYIARALGVPTIFSLHDYYAICWQFNLVDYRGAFCSPEDLSETSCDICLERTRGARSGSQSCRRAFFGRLLAHIDVLHAGTQEVADRIQGVYPALAGHPGLRVRGMPISDGQVSPGERALNLPIKVALLGNFSPNKGAHMLLALFKQMRGDQVAFDVLGHIPPDLRGAVASTSLPNVSWHKGYRPEDLNAKLGEASIALFASNWPETYCLSLSEAWRAGLVPVAPDIGAFSVRIQHDRTGVLYPPGNLGELVDILRMLIGDPSRLRRIQENIGPGLYETYSAHLLWLRGLYMDLIASAPRACQAAALSPKDELTARDCGIVLQSEYWLRSPQGRTLSPRGLAAPFLAAYNLSVLIRVAIAHVRRHGFAAVYRRALRVLRSSRF